MTDDRIARMRALLVEHDAAHDLGEWSKQRAELARTGMAIAADLPALLDELEAARADLARTRDALARERDPSGYALAEGHLADCARVRWPRAHFSCDCEASR
jgi:hypothetical protein